MWVTSVSFAGHIRIDLWVSGSSGLTSVTHFQPCKGSSKTDITADLPCLSYMNKTWFSQSKAIMTKKPVKTIASECRDLMVVYLVYGIMWVAESQTHQQCL